MRAPLLFLLLVIAIAAVSSCSGLHKAPSAKTEAGQVPTWSQQDMDFFLHGSMSSEFVPESVLRTFIVVYPDLFPTSDLSHLGLVPDPAFGWPVGISRRRPAHLDHVPSLGINCAACHSAEIESSTSGKKVPVLGVTAHFDVEAFYGSIIGATFRTAEPANMRRFLAEYQKQTGTTATADQILRIFHEMRVALHIPDTPPKQAPPASGPGRNDAFGLLSAVLFNAPQPYAPVKFGLVWNVDKRRWVHWDGNTRSPIGRNLLASIGLGAPLMGNEAQLDFNLIRRQTELSEQIRAPRYPFAIDRAAAARGKGLYQASCASCHAGPEGDNRLHSPSEIGTDPLRATLFTQLQADRFNKFLAGLKAEGYVPATEKGVRTTQKYWTADLAGVWARAPYLHNGSVRTMEELLTSPASRATTFHRGSRLYDEQSMGYTDAGTYLFDTRREGNSNSGHDYGTSLSSTQKRELMEYLKSL